MRSTKVGIFRVATRIPGKQRAASPLYFDGRREDLAFEKPDGKSADRRQHLRLWMVLQSGADGGLVWLGSASFGSGVTLSRDTGQVTRKIAPNIDQERDRQIDCRTGSRPQRSLASIRSGELAQP